MTFSLRAGGVFGRVASSMKVEAARKTAFLLRLLGALVPIRSGVSFKLTFSFPAIAGDRGFTLAVLTDVVIRR